MDAMSPINLTCPGKRFTQSASACSCSTEEASLGGGSSAAAARSCLELEEAEPAGRVARPAEELPLLSPLRPLAPGRRLSRGPVRATTQPRPRRGRPTPRRPSEGRPVQENQQPGRTNYHSRVPHGLSLPAHPGGVAAFGLLARTRGVMAYARDAVSWRASEEPPRFPAGQHKFVFPGGWFSGRKTSSSSPRASPALSAPRA